MTRTRLASVLAVGLSAANCRPAVPFVWVHDLPREGSGESGETTIEPLDTILVDVRDQPTLSGELVVREDGFVLQSTIGNVKVAGLTRQQAAAAVNEQLRGVVVNPRVTVWIVRRAPIRVNVIGEVRTPGVYELGRDRSLPGALAAASWLGEYAHADRVFVVRRGQTTPRIRFRVVDLTAAESRSAAFRLRDGDTVVVE